jgi:hypothetical protein
MRIRGGNVGRQQPGGRGHQENISEDLAAGDIQSGQMVVVDLRRHQFSVCHGGPGILCSRGAIMYWPTETPPKAVLERDGSAVSRTTYAACSRPLGRCTESGMEARPSTFRTIEAYLSAAGRMAPRTIRTVQSRTNRGDGTTGDHVGTMQADEFESNFQSPQIWWLGQLRSGWSTHLWRPWAATKRGPSTGPICPSSSIEGRALHADLPLQGETGEFLRASEHAWIPWSTKKTGSRLPPASEFNVRTRPRLPVSTRRSYRDGTWSWWMITAGRILE